MRLGGEGQIRLLQVEESERAEVEREARELTEEAERLAANAAVAATIQSTFFAMILPLFVGKTDG